jgi:hypothetical protein
MRSPATAHPRLLPLLLCAAALCHGCAGDESNEIPVDAGLDGASDTLVDASAPDLLTWPKTTIETIVGKDAVALRWEALPAASYTLYWASQPGVAKTGAAIKDVKPGYIHRGLTNGQTYYYTLRGSLAGALSPFLPEVSATPKDEFELVSAGSGSIPDLKNGGTRRLSVKQMMHAIMLPDGYLQAELDAGIFTKDVLEYSKLLFAIDPYDELAGAFVVWMLPRASKAHVTSADPQSADSAFRVPITASGYGVGKQMTETAKKVWEAMQGFPYPVSEYYSGGGRTAYLAKSFTIHILVLDPARGRTGFSGRTVKLYAPGNTQKALSVAIAHNLAHEFTHAFARLADEYLELDYGLTSTTNASTDKAAYVSNVVQEPSCATVPWKHLLVGGMYNPKQAQLVGAFGHAKLGFHPELKCLMNGTHDNAQLYGGNGNLRTTDRLCNFCRELLTFRLHERTGILSDADTALDSWKSAYRDGFYKRFGFNVPQVVPQQTSVGKAWYQPCTAP